MTWLPPLLVAIPLLAAAAAAGLDHVTPAPVQDALVVAAAAATTAFAFVLLWHSESHEVVHWFGGWQTRGGVALGIDFAVGPLAAGMCAVIGLVVTLALLFSLTFLREAARLFDALMLVALAAMCGFAMSGDLFNLFVWLELMGVAAYALTGFQVERLGPVQGAVNFAITNSVGGYLFAVGIALVYARTGALNLAQIGNRLSHGPAGGLVIVAMTLLFCGFLIKGAVVSLPPLGRGRLRRGACARVCSAGRRDDGHRPDRRRPPVLDGLRRSLRRRARRRRRAPLDRPGDRGAHGDDGLPAAALEADARLFRPLPHRDHARGDRPARLFWTCRRRADVSRARPAHRGSLLRRGDPPRRPRADRRAPPTRPGPGLLGAGTRVVRRDDRARGDSLRRHLSRSRPDRRRSHAAGKVVGASAALARLGAGRCRAASRRRARLLRLGRR